MPLPKQEYTIKEAIEKSIQLADLVKQTYSPDLIVAIAQGGILPGFEISKRLNQNYTQIIIQRNINLTRVYELVPKTLKPIVSLYHKYLFMVTNPKIIKKENFNCNGINILVVDDAVHTGKTLQVALNHLQNKGPSQIKTATINYITKVTPDYSITKAKIKYPWSKNSPEYKKFQSYAKSVSNQTKLQRVINSK